jgi:hypothetical protein
MSEPQSVVQMNIAVPRELKVRMDAVPASVTWSGGSVCGLRGEAPGTGQREARTYKPLIISQVLWNWVVL